MFSADDEEGDFLSPIGGAKLASLFELDNDAYHGNESFHYTAPKQPRKTSNQVTQKPVSPPGAPAVLFATAVQAFRYVNGQYVKQGRLGAALLANHTTKEYKLLLYLSQQKQVTTANIHVCFVFTVQPNNYCTFYDDQRQNWSLMFESEKALCDFCKEVCLAKANSTPSLDTVVVQDIRPGEGQGVENGDSLEVVYTGWFLQNYTFGQIFDSNQNKEKLLRLKIGAGKIIKGWDEGMLGMKKAGSRLIIVPPNLAYGSKGVPDLIPANSTLIFEAELRRVKFSRDSGSDRSNTSSRDSAAPSPTPSQAPSVENLALEPAVQTTCSGPGRPRDTPLLAKSNCLSKQLTNPDVTKAKLISRIAKMGQPMLPFITGVSSQPDSSDSELEDSSGSRAEDRPAPPLSVPIYTDDPASVQVHPVSLSQTALPSTLLLTVGPKPALPVSTHAYQTTSQLQPVREVYSTQTVPYMGSGDMTSFVMTEARQHNTEIRLAVGKVADKLDQLALKVDDIHRQETISKSVSSMSMEASMIMYNIQRIVQENECLKKEVLEKSNRIEEQNQKIGELINQNQRHIEQSNLLLEQRNDSLKSSSEQIQAKLVQVEQDKVRLAEDLASTSARLSQLQLENSAQQQKSIELQSKLNLMLQDSESQCDHMTHIEKQLEELKETAERAKVQCRLEKQRCKELQLKNNNMEEELQDLKADKNSLERTILERKKKWQAERQCRDEEVEELRRSSQQELENLQGQLRKVRTSTNNAASEQLSQMQAELEKDWKVKCEQMLASANEQQSRQLAKLEEQRDDLQNELTQLQEKYSALEQQSLAVRGKLEKRVAEQQKKMAEKDISGDTAAEVKRVMNGVFHSLRGEFDLSESYTGRDVLSVIVTIIKKVTLQLLSDSTKSSVSQEEANEEKEEEEECDDVKQTENEVYQTVKRNGEREIKEEKKEKVTTAFEQVGVSQVNQNVALDAKIVPESQTSSQAPPLEASGLFSDSLAKLKPQETAAAECEAGEHSIPETTSEQNNFNKSRVPDNKPDENLLLSHRQKTVSEPDDLVNSKVFQVSLDNGKHVEEIGAISQKAFGPPDNPPPPPNNLQKGGTSVTGAMVEEKVEELFFQITTSAKAHAAPTEKEEEDEMSLKGCPPPAPLFGDDEDDEDLDWLN